MARYLEERDGMWEETPRSRRTISEVAHYEDLLRLYHAGDERLTHMADYVWNTWLHVYAEHTLSEDW